MTDKDLNVETGKLKIFEKKLKILHLEDLPSDALLIKNAIKKGNINFEILVVETKNDFVKALNDDFPDIILADHSLPSFNSHEALIILHDTGIKIPFILITSAMSEEFAVDIISKGASDYILKDRLTRLPVAITKAIEKFRLEKERQIFFDELIKKEKRYRALVENSADAIVILSAEGKPIYASASAIRMLGYTEAELFNLDLLTIAHPDDVESLGKVMEKVLANPGVAMNGHTGRMRHKNGSWRWLEATVTNMLHEPAINGIIDNFRDVTEKKLTEDLLVHNENKFRRLIENGADGMAILSMEGKPLYVSPSIENVLGYNQVEGMQLDLLSLTHKDDTSSLINIMQQAMAAPGIPIRGDAVRIRHKNGSWRWVDGVLTNMLHDPSINGIVDNFRDVTEKKLAEEKLKESEDTYRSFFENSMDGILLTMTDGKILAANPAACTMFQMTEAEICAVGRQGLVDPLDPRLTRGLVERQRVDKVQGELSFRRKDGSLFPGELTSAVYSDEHGIKKTSTIVRDVSARKAAEEKIIHLNRLYSFLSQINKTIVQSADEQTVFKEACRIAIEVGKFRVAWIGIVDSIEQTIKLVEHYGAAPEDITKYLNHIYKASGPLWQVTQSNKPYVCNNVERDFELLEWKPYAAENGFRSMIILPITKSGKIVCTLNLYSSELDFFTLEETNLLEEAAGDISFALEIFEKQQQKLLADELVKHKEMRLNQAQAIAHLGSWEASFSTGGLTCSDEALRIYGLTTENSIQTYQSWLSYIHPADLDYVLSIIKEAEKTFARTTFNHRIVRKDGIIRHLQSHAEFELDSNGKPTGLYGVSHDVTEMKQAEEELRRSEANLQAIFSNTSEGFILADTNGIIKSINEKATEYVLLNTYGKVAVGESIFDYVDVSRQENFKAVIANILAGKGINYDHFYTRKNAEDIWLNFDINPVLENGQIVGICIAGRDITERKKVEQQLKESEQFNRGILASLSSHIAVVDSTGTIIATNKAWNDFALNHGAISLERTSEGSNYFEVCKNAAAAGDIIGGKVLEGMQQVFTAENQTFSLEYPCHSPGEERWFVVHVSNFGADKSKIVVSHQDITERKISEEKLRVNEQHLSEAQKLAKVGSWNFDFRNDHLTWSEELYNIFDTDKKTFEETQGSFLHLIHAAERERVLATSRKTQATGEPFEIEYNITTASGEHRVIYEHGYGEMDEHGKVVRLFGTAQDITERKKAEEALLISEQKLRMIFSSTTDTVFLLSVENGNRFIFNSINDAGLKAMGIAKEEIINKLVDEVIPPGSLQLVLNKYAEAIQNKKSVQWEETSEYPTGIKTGIVTVTPIYDENEKCIWLVGTVYDITERRKAEDENRFQANLLNTIGQAAIATNADGIINYWNRSAEQIFGWSKQEAIGQNIINITPSYATIDQAIEIMNNIKAGLTWSGEFEVQRKDGTVFPAFVTNTPIYDDKNQLAGVIGVSSDITERKKAEEAIKRSSAQIEQISNDLNKILNSSLDIICTIDEEGKFVKVSAASEEVWGFTPKELQGQLFMNYVFDADVELTTKTATEIMSGISYSMFENRYVHKNGNVVPMLWSARWDDNDKLIYCIAKDATEKKRLEKAFINERKQFRDLVMQAPASMGTITGPNYIYEVANAPYLSLIGKNDIIGKSVKEILPEIESQGFMAILDDVYKTGKAFIADEMLIKFNKNDAKNPVERYLNFMYQPYRNIDNVIEGIHFFAVDVTEQVLSRKKIEQSERFFKGVIENSDDMITMVEPSGKTLYASPAVSRKFGYTNEECLSLNMAEIVHPDDVLIVQEFMMKLMATPGVPLECPPIRDRKKDGTYMWVEGTLTNLMEIEGINAIIANFRDVTERKEAETKIRVSEMRYRQIVETAQEGIWVIDENNVTTFVNKKMCEILGYARDEIMGKTHLSFKGAEGQKIGLANIERRKQGIAETHRASYITRQGKLIWAHVSSNPIFNDGVYKGTLSMVSDITDRLLAEETLKENEQKYRELSIQLQLESARLNKAQSVAKVGSWENDLLSRNLTWSLETYRIFDFEDTNYLVSQSTFLALAHPNDTAKLEAAIEVSIQTKMPGSVEHKIITKKGTEKYVLESWEVICDETGIPVKFSGTCQDITDRKISEVRLIESEANLKEAQRIAEVGSWEINMVDHKHEWSDEFYRIAGIEPGEVLPSEKEFFSVIHPHDLSFAKTNMETAFKTLADFSFSFRLERRRDELGYAMVEWKFELDSNHKPVRLAGILRDITKQKKAEIERTKMIEDIIQRNKDLEQFSYIVSHNLRAPLANIIGLNAELDYNSHTIEIKEMFKKELSANINRLDNVISDLNNILQVKKQINEKKETIILSDLVANIVSSIHIVENITIETDFDELNEFFTIKSYLHSIFYNLITNAIKYRRTDVDLLILITTKKIDDRLVITVKDNGSGIDLIKKGKEVFGLYKRFHSNIEGKGMGLFMVKTQVEALEGKIFIKSQVNIGTEFTIEFEL